MLSLNQKSLVRLYLGYPDNYRYKNTRLESVLDNLSPDAESQVGVVLTNIAAVESQILAVGIPNAGLKRVDEIWFFEARAVRMELTAFGKIYISRLSIITGVPVYSDVFGHTGYLGDTFSSGGHFGSGGSSRGGMIPLG